MIIFRMACIIVLSLGQIILGLYMINFASMIVKNRHVKMTLVYSLGPAMSFWFPAICLLEATSPFSEQILRINPSGMPALVAIIALGMGVGLSLYIMVREWLKNRGRHIPSSARLHHSTVYKNRDLGRFLPPILPFSTGRLGNLVNDLYSLEVNEWHVEFDNLPAEFHGFRIGHLTDLHCDKNLDAAYFEACMRLMKSLLPDILVMTGDLISKKGYAEMAADLLVIPEAPFGSFVLRGNHDFREDPEGIRYALSKKRIKLLDNKAEILSRGGSHLRLAGIEHPWNKADDWARHLLPRDGIFTICATHTPDNFINATMRGAELILCGHTHGGQIRLPLMGPVVCPSRFSRTYDQGFFRKNHSLLYVGRGIGATIPFRLNCLPEITLFVLKRSEKKSPA